MLCVLDAAAVERVAHRAGDELTDHAVYMLTQILSVKHLAALVVYDVALLVHDVVVLQNALSRLEVAALDGLLRLLDRTGQHLVVKRRIVVHAEGLHHAHDALRAEKTHDVVRHRKEEAALSGVALTAGTASELIVDSSRFVALGAEDE